jgi:hypothetical protein
VRGVAAFPGGAVGSVFGFDLGKRLFDLNEHARGPASAGLVAPMALSTQALSTGAAVRGVAALPSGAVGSVFGFDLGKRLFDLSEHRL